MFFRISGYMVVVAIVAKLILFLLNVPQQTMAMSSMFVNLLVVLVGSFFAVRYYKIKNPNSDIKSEIKAGMRSTTVFALFVSLFVLVYYNYIDTHYFANMIDERVLLAAENPEADLDQVRKTGELLFSPKIHASITLFGLTIIGALYTIVLVLLMRRFYGSKST